VKPDGILIRYGEIGLKGKVTRNRFERQLKRNIKKALKNSEIECTITVIQGRILVMTNEFQDAIDQLIHVFGITSISPAYLISTDLSTIKKNALHLVKKHKGANPSFGLRVTRVGNHPFTSQDVAIDVGAYIQQETSFPVDLTHPDCELFIEIRDDTTMMFLEKILGPGGMPVGTQGRVLTMINDPNDLLASWYLLKRGCDMVFIYSHQHFQDQFDSFFSTWHIPKYLRFVEKNDDYWNQVNSIISEQKCQAVCDGFFFGRDDNGDLDHIRFLRNKIDIPILTPLISYNKETINKLCGEKEIII